jgi:hypothetical protein
MLYLLARNIANYSKIIIPKGEYDFKLEDLETAYKQQLSRTNTSVTY